MSNRYNSILETVGNTPCVRINNLTRPDVNLYVKIEAFNPMASVKDRLALAIIEKAEQDGSLRPGQTVIEATSGNTGIGLAMVCAQKGYPLVIVMAENFSVERRRMLRFLGARVVLTPASERGSGMLAKARELAQAHGWFLAGQFENEANADVHSRTTAQEILADFAEDGLDYFVTGYGTGGTLKGVARTLKAQSPGTCVVACEPDNSALLASDVTQPFDAASGQRISHPSARPHPMQGWGPDFIPQFAEQAREQAWIDELLPVNGAAALQASRDLAAREGIFCGITSGATMVAALEICARVPAGTNVLCMLPDTGERYMSTMLFDNVQSEMNADERQIAASTPSCRFDAPPPAPVAAPAPTAVLRPLASPAEDSAAQVVQQIIDDADQPVVMFALEWCEFCWSVRKMFAAAGVEMRSIDLDSVAYQKDDLGTRIRADLKARTGMSTIPQVFIGGQFIGGCTDVFDAYNDGTLRQLLASAGQPAACEGLEPAAFLPTWLHTRGAA